MNSVEDTDNHAATRDAVGYISLRDAPAEVYSSLRFRCGLEIHQQLSTEKKLFCRCPTGLYQNGEDFDAQLVRHMRPTLSELGEYDGTALMEFRTRKNITYRIKSETACTYDIDDTPPFPLNREALAIAVEMALLLETSVVGEIHIARKQYLDGSIPTGFQRTAIVGISGRIPVSGKQIGIRQLSIEEDSCREVRDIGHERVYTTDRLGMPLVETVTEPELLTPHEAAEAADYLRYLARSTGKVNVGIGAARQDVNVSIAGGTRVEIKGVQHIRWIPRLTHNEAFRQKALLRIRDVLRSRVDDPSAWRMAYDPIDSADPVLGEIDFPEGCEARRIVLPQFGGLLSHFTNPGRCFADEISDRLKVIACIEKPNMIHSDAPTAKAAEARWSDLRSAATAGDADALLIVWGPPADLPTAIETIEERCRQAFEGVPNETRRGLPDGTTVFERVLPGPDRMYPDTDSAPIPIDEGLIDLIRAALPEAIAAQLAQLEGWGVPRDTIPYILRRRLFSTLRWMVEEVGLGPVFAASLLGHTVRHTLADRTVDTDRLRLLVSSVLEAGLHEEILRPAIPAGLATPNADVDSLLKRMAYVPKSESQILSRIPELLGKALGGTTTDGRKRRDWIMGQLRPQALGNMRLSLLAEHVKEALIA